jgi:hypothetical protein
MYHIVGDGTLIGMIVPECFKGVTVKAVKPIFGAKPQKAALVLQAAVNGIVR